MFRPLVGVLLCPLLTACGRNLCNEPDACTGTLVIDLSSKPPAFSIDGLGRVSPEELEIRPDAHCGGGGPAVWSVWSIPEGSMPIVYGRLPEGANEEDPAQSLVEGVTYSVSFMHTLGPRAAASSGGWHGFFTAGDPESAELFSERCP